MVGRRTVEKRRINCINTDDEPSRVSCKRRALTDTDCIPSFQSVPSSGYCRKQCCGMNSKAATTLLKRFDNCNYIDYVAEDTFSTILQYSVSWLPLSYLDSDEVLKVIPLLSKEWCIATLHGLFWKQLAFSRWNDAYSIYEKWQDLVAQKFKYECYCWRCFFQFMSKREFICKNYNLTLAIPEYMPYQSQLSAPRRKVLVDWLSEVTELFKCGPRVLYFAVYLIDVYCNIDFEVKLSKYQLVGAVSLLVSMTYLGINVPASQMVVENLEPELETLPINENNLNSQNANENNNIGNDFATSSQEGDSNKINDAVITPESSIAYLTDGAFEEKDVWEFRQHFISVLSSHHSCFQCLLPQINAFEMKCIPKSLNTSFLVCDWLNIFLGAAGKYEGSNSVTYCMAHYIAELALIEYNALQYSPAIVAAAAFALTCFNLDINKAWVPLLYKVSNFTLEDIEPCMNTLLTFVKKPAELDPSKKVEIRAVYDKYSHPQYLEVSYLLLEELRETTPTMNDYDFS